MTTTTQRRADLTGPAVLTDRARRARDAQLAGVAARHELAEAGEQLRSVLGRFRLAPAA